MKHIHQLNRYAEPRELSAKVLFSGGEAANSARLLD
jgi:hypothetical protein